MDEHDGRLDRLRAQVAAQALLTRHLRLESKALRAASSAIIDECSALRLVARGVTKDALPPIPTHPPTD